ncbi:MAG: hypothetical protein ACKVT1_06060 [Dehalococcoidia bacterium]
MDEQPHGELFESCQQHAYEMAMEAESLLRAGEPDQLTLDRANVLVSVGQLWVAMAENELRADRSAPGADAERLAERARRSGPAGGQRT